MFRRFVIIVSCVCAIVCGAGSLYMLFNTLFLSTVELHLLCAVFGVLTARLVMYQFSPTGFEMIFSVFIPCVGGAVVALIVILTRFEPSSNLTEEYVKYLDSASFSDASRPRSMVDYTLPNPMEIEPLYDILFSRAVDDDKKNAVEALMRIGTPTAVSILREVLRKGDGKARIYAAGALSRIDDQFAQRMNVFMEEQAVAEGTEKGRLSVRIAELCLDYLDMGLCDRSQRTDYIKLGLQHANDAMELLSDNGLLLLQGQLLIADAQFAEAEALLSLYINQNADDVQALFKRAECRYELHDIKNMRADCMTIKHMEDVPEQILATINFWI